MFKKKNMQDSLSDIKTNSEGQDSASSVSDQNGTDPSVISFTSADVTPDSGCSDFSGQVSESADDFHSQAAEVPSEPVESDMDLQKEDPPVIVVTPEPAVQLSAKPASTASAVTVYIPCQPEGPTATQLEKVALEAQKALKSRRKADRKRLRSWKKDARQKATVYLRRLRDASTPEEKTAVRNEYHADRRAWRKSIKELDESEKKLQKQAFRAFKRRITRTRRLICWILLLSLLAGVGYAAAPLWKNTRALLKLDLTPDEELHAASAEALRSVSESIADEGIVLLKNANNLLPLQKKKICVFGEAAYNLCCGNSGPRLTLFEGLEAAGISYDLELHSVYTSALSAQSGIKKLVSGKNYGDLSGTALLSDELISSCREYTDQAMVVLSCREPDGTDFASEELALSVSQTALLRKVAENFSHVIVVLTGSNMMETGILDELDSIDSVLWLGCCGPEGTVSLGKILSGEVNPSGRLTDTWAYHCDSAPSSVNFTTDPKRYTSSVSGLSYVQYEEGIYVGYRYYETAYQGNETGYRKAVQYPFGYGLSYTSFDWETLSFSASEVDGTVTWKVRVVNSGSVAGKDVLQLYFSSPWTEGAAEKSSVELAACAKTPLLTPGAGCVLTLSFPVEYLSYYNMEKGAYITDTGDYTVSLCRNAHDIAESRILTVKAEETVSESSKETENELDSVSSEITPDTDSGHEPSSSTGNAGGAARSGSAVCITCAAADTECANLFSYADGGLTVLSRSDWTGTYPRGIANDPDADTLKADLRKYNNPEPSSAELPETEANNGIKLASLRGLAYDDPVWSSYLDQFSMDELYELCANAGWHTAAFKRLGIPETEMLSGSSSLSVPFKELDSSEFPPLSLVASTWNSDLACEYGKAVGLEVLSYGAQVWYGPSLTLHRSSHGGCNYLSCSEDPFLTGTIGASVVRGAQSEGVITAVSGFGAGCEADVNTNGTCVWVNEQALRELYLRPFEIAIRDGGAKAVVVSGSRLGCRWSGADSTLLTALLREEWGFDGFVTTESVSESYMRSSLACLAGTDLMRETGLQHSERTLRRAYSRNSSGIALALRDAAHHFCYTLVNSSALFAE